MNVLIAPDKFKGALDAVGVASALQAGLAAVWPEASYRLLPVADGGEGTAEVLHRALGGEWTQATVHDPIGRTIEARYSWAELDGEPVAIFEMSEASGLRRLSPQERDPLHANTFGTGELILAAAQRGAKTIIIGLGGSATNDGGIGMAAALGFKFLDAHGRAVLPQPASLGAVTRIETPVPLRLPKIIAAVDVQNPLLGERGATYTYGPQKGAGPAELECLESNLTRLADLVQQHSGSDLRHQPGTGSAGGLGFGLAAFCGAEIRDGFGIVAEAVRLEEAVAGADLVLTGEGSMDAQTLHGKAPAGVARLARKHRKPLLAFAGKVSEVDQLQALFDVVCPIVDKPMPLEQAMEQTIPLLKTAAARIARAIVIGRNLAGTD